jgi:hypothetical protein
MRCNAGVGRVGATLGVLLAACSREALPIELPIDAESGAAIVLVERGATLEVVAIDPASGEGRSALPVLADYDGAPIQLSVVVYPATLTELGIPSGVLRAAQPGSRRVLPPGGQIFERRIEGGEAGTWAIAESLSGRAASFRSPDLPVTDPCRTFSGMGFSLSSTVPISALVPYDEDHALVISSEQERSGPSSTWLYLAGHDGLLRVDEAIPGFTAGVGREIIVGGARTADGRLWLAVTQGGNVVRLARGSLEDGFELLPPIPPPRFHWVRWLLPDPIDPGRLLALQDNGGLLEWRHDLGTWRVIIDGEPGLGRCNFPGNAAHSNRYCGGIGRIGGEVFAAHPWGQQRVLRLSDDIPSWEPLVDEPGGGSLTAFATTPVGPVAVVSGTNIASIQLRGPNGWRPLTGSGGGPTINTQRPLDLIAYGDGFVFTGAFGYLTQYAGGRLCESLGGVAGQAMSRLVRIRGGLVMGTGARPVVTAAEQPLVFVLRELEPE